MSTSPITLAPRPRPPVAGAADGEQRLLRATVQTYLDEMAELSRRTREALDLTSHPSADVAEVIGAAARRTVPRWHFEMLNDVQRNDALVKVVAAAVRPGDHVLDIGSGTGLLAMVAAQSGAARVTTCEANPLLAEIATQVIDAHGYSDIVTVVPRWSTDLVAEWDLGGRVDLIVSEIVDCGLVGEGLFSTVRHAREELLAPGGRMVPRAARLLGRVVESDAAASLNRVTAVGGFDVSPLNVVSTRGHFPIRTHTRAHRMLSPEIELADFDLHRDPLTDNARRLTVPVTSGTAHGLIAWFELDLGADTVLCNSPDNAESHWGQAFVPFAEPVPVHDQDLGVELRWTNGRLFATPAFRPTTRSTISRRG